MPVHAQASTRATKEGNKATPVSVKSNREVSKKDDDKNNERLFCQQGATEKSETNERVKMSSITKNNTQNGRTNALFHENDVREFLGDVHSLILDKALYDGTENDHKIVDFRHPLEMLKELQLDIGDKGSDHKTLLGFCEKLIQMSVKTGKPGFYNQLYGFVDPYGLAGSWVTDSMNTALHTYEVSPAFTMIEHYLIQKVCKMIGFNNGDGIFCPGGSFANMMGIHLGRYKMNPDFKRTGMYNQERMVVYASEGSHYSSLHGVIFLGLGAENLIKVKTDDRGRMCMKNLEACIQQTIKEGNRPTVVVATSGTTVLGAFDPISDIADICQMYNIWLHVDSLSFSLALLSSILTFLISILFTISCSLFLFSLLVLSLFLFSLSSCSLSLSSCSLSLSSCSLSLSLSLSLFLSLSLSIYLSIYLSHDIGSVFLSFLFPDLSISLSLCVLPLCLSLFSLSLSVLTPLSFSLRYSLFSLSLFHSLFVLSSLSLSCFLYLLFFLLFFSFTFSMLFYFLTLSLFFALSIFPLFVVSLTVVFSLCVSVFSFTLTLSLSHSFTLSLSLSPCYFLFSLLLFSVSLGFSFCFLFDFLFLCSSRFFLNLLSLSLSLSLPLYLSLSLAINNDFG
ncbi:Cysteine sulfinic acid decarboxylase,Glutamate decarboxylase 1,Acidic amino acid decarboxylase GADL1 [Acanthosepion pharaonis]|uniref:Cysteine sulfinic acid decarboxylase,Glutamate decarboxylase 1,Acidic amino acid decarboxylase GADL1 n=1 Tax=Acanthosepion pharaonis TaxID=158019 RepID=A0A812E6X0_ACAPH|nr:Cysteine sulfinic acid decarboxylase,Glutamate decarboxylase 1,Acidic amino acid decarboxylase GADL1 [Sepia pharaonis]